MKHKCSASGPGWKCDLEHHALGLCNTHYTQHLRGKPLTKPRRQSLAKAYRHDPNALINEVPKGYKRCLDCHVIKPLSDYTKHTKSPDGLFSACKHCAANYQMELRYGIGAAEWWRWKMLDQRYRCAHCGSDSPGKKSSWHFDHDHRTGEWRDILCFWCNLLMGFREKGYDAARAIASMEKRYPVI